MSNRQIPRKEQSSQPAREHLPQIGIFLVVLPDKAIEYIMGDLGHGERGQGDGLAQRRLQDAKRIGEEPFEERAVLAVEQHIPQVFLPEGQQQNGAQHKDEMAA